MTVKELIEKLAALPQDAEVKIRSFEGDGSDRYTGPEDEPIVTDEAVIFYEAMTVRELGRFIECPAYVAIAYREDR